MMIRKNINLALIIIVILIQLLMVGCQPNESNSKLRVSTKATLQFRMTWNINSERGAVITKIVDEFNGSSQRAFVELISGNETYEDYEKALSENVIDVYVIPYRYIKNPNISHSLEPLDRIFENEWDTFYGHVVELGETEEGIMAIPWIGHSMCLIFNQELVRRTGLNPYLWESSADLLEGVKAIEEVTGYRGIGLVGADHHDLTWMVNQFIYSFDGELISSETDTSKGDIAINSEEAINALDYYINGLGQYAQEGWENHTGEDVLEAFAEGAVAFEIQGPWAVSDMGERGNPFEIGIVPLKNMGIYSEVDSLMLAIDEDTDNMAGAVEFISYLNSEVVQKIIMKGEYDIKSDSYYPFSIPIKKTMVESELSGEYDIFKLFIEGFELASISTPNEAWALIEDEYTYYIHQAVIGALTIEEALEAVENIMDKNP